MDHRPWTINYLSTYPPPHAQGPVLFFPHETLCIAMIIVAQQVQYSMNHDPMELFFERLLIGLSIFFYAIDADKDIGPEALLRIFVIRKGKYICEVVVGKVLTIEVQKIGVGTENVGNLIQVIAMRLDDL